MIASSSEVMVVDADEDGRAVSELIEDRHTLRCLDLNFLTYDNRRFGPGSRSIDQQDVGSGEFLAAQHAIRCSRCK